MVSQMNDIDSTPVPQGDLALQTIAMPKDTNANGDIFGGWIVSQIDIAGAIVAGQRARGRVVALMYLIIVLAMICICLAIRY